MTFADRIKNYLEATEMADPAMIQTSINAGFGELYARGGANVKDWQKVAARKLTYKFGELPPEVVKLTGSADIQPNAIFYSIRGWGARATSWQIESNEIAGFTDEEEVWNDLAHVVHGHVRRLADHPISGRQRLPSR